MLLLKNDGSASIDATRMDLLINIFSDIILYQRYKEGGCLRAYGSHPEISELFDNLFLYNSPILESIQRSFPSTNTKHLQEMATLFEFLVSHEWLAKLFRFQVRLRKTLNIFVFKSSV